LVLPYHRPRRQTVDSAARRRLRVHAGGYPTGTLPGWLASYMRREAMGDYGIAGLWLFLALSPFPAIRGAAPRIVAGGSHPAETGERRAQRGAVTVHDLCRTRLWCPARLRHRGRVGAVLLRGGQRLQRGVHGCHDVPADRRDARSGADPDASTAPQI